MLRFGIILVLFVLALGAFSFWKGRTTVHDKQTANALSQVEAAADTQHLRESTGQRNLTPAKAEAVALVREQAGEMALPASEVVFPAGGSVQMLPQRSSDSIDGITLVWQTETGEQVLALVSAGKWSAKFLMGIYHLDSARSAGGELLPFLRAQSVSNTRQEADVVLAAADAIVLVVQDATTGLELSGLKVIPEVTPEKQSEVAQTIGQKQHTKAERQAMLVAMGIWRISGDSPLVLPSVPIAHSVTIARDGYSNAVVPLVDGPGVYRAQLHGKRGMEFHLQTDGASHRKWELELRVDGGGRPQRFTGLDGHRPVFAEIPQGNQVTATIFEELPLGVGGQVFCDTFALQPTGVTVAKMNIQGGDSESSVGDVRIGIRADRETEGMNLWGVTLLPNDRPRGPEGVDFEWYPRLQLKSWGAEVPLRFYRKTFIGIRPGTYELVIDPIQFRTEIEVVEGVLREYNLEVPTLVDLRIWAVNQQGKSIENAQKAGILYWKEVSEASRKREAEDPLYAHNKGASEFVLDFQRGFAQAARPLEGGGWLIEAKPGIQIKMMYLGPTRGEPMPKSMVVPNGPSEDTLEIQL